MSPCDHSLLKSEIIEDLGHRAWLRQKLRLTPGIVTAQPYVSEIATEKRFIQECGGLEKEADFNGRAPSLNGTKSISGASYALSKIVLRKPTPFTVSGDLGAECHEHGAHQRGLRSLIRSFRH